MTQFTIFTFKDISGNVYWSNETLVITSKLNYLYKRRNKPWKGVYQILVNGKRLYNEDIGDIMCQVITRRRLVYIMLVIFKWMQTKYLWR